MTKPKTDPNTLDDEPTGAAAPVGRRLVVRYAGEDFELQDVAHDRPWEDVMGLLAAANGELGVTAVAPAIREIIGDEQMERTKGWTFAQFMQFTMAVGKRIGQAVGEPGE